MKHLVINHLKLKLRLSKKKTFRSVWCAQTYIACHVSIFLKEKKIQEHTLKSIDVIMMPAI